MKLLKEKWERSVQSTRGNGENEVGGGLLPQHSMMTTKGWLDLSQAKGSREGRLDYCADDVQN